MKENKHQDSYDIMADVRKAQANGEVTKEDADAIINAELKFIKTGEY